jgi:hypothetical protein
MTFISYGCRGDSAGSFTFDYLASQCSMPGRHFRHPWQSDAGGRTPKVGALDDAWSSCRVFGHCPDDADFSGRWNVLKAYFSRNMEKGERVSASRKSRREGRVWQRRFWEQLLRDHTDFNRHVDTIHWNWVKHGWVN